MIIEMIYKKNILMDHINPHSPSKSLISLS